MHTRLGWADVHYCFARRHAIDTLIDVLREVGESILWYAEEDG